MKKFLFLALLFLFFSSFTYAQEEKQYTLEGVVLLKNTESTIPYVQIFIKESGQWNISDSKGNFSIPGIYPGRYTVQASALGYAPYEISIEISRNIRQFKIQLAEENLTLNEVVVQAKSGGSLYSSKHIGRQAISHVQASSLADVMQLLPGNLITNPNLTKPNTIQIRNTGDDLQFNGARGVALLVNGMQMGNDAEMASVSGSGKWGIPVMDFRNYSTDHIESIQVLKGVVSAEYGDFTSGAVLVNTRTGRSPFEVRLKADPKTKSASLNKGFILSPKGGILNIEADYARAASDLRSPVATFSRTDVGLTYSRTFNQGGAPFRLNARLSGNFIANRVKSDPDVSKDDFTNLHENRFALSLYGNWMLNKSWISSLNYNVSASYAHNTTHNYEVLTQAVLPNTQTQEEGLQEGYLMNLKDAYDKRIEDVPLSLNAKISGLLNKKTGGTFWRTSAGLEWSSKGNLGEGVYYTGAQPQYFRQYAYREVPFLHHFSAFLEERITVPLAATSLEVSAGLRLTQMILPGYSYKPTLDPRLNARYTIIQSKPKQFIRSLSVRGGWGILRKSPPLSLLYPGHAYLDKAVFQYTHADGQSLAVIDTRILPDKLNYNLAPAKTRNIELGTDVNLGGVKLGITWFNEFLKNGVSANANHLPQQIKYYATVTDVNAAPKFEGGKVWIKDGSGNYEEAPYRIASVFLRHSIPDNRAQQRKWGIEYEADFGKIKSLNTSVLVTGAYIRNKYSADGLAYEYRGGGDPVIPQNDFPYVSVFASNASNLGSISVNDRLSTHISFITNIPKIRLVVSLTTQCIWMDRRWTEFEQGNIYYTDATGKPVYEDLSGQKIDKLLYRDPVAYVDFNGNMRPFSDYHTTTDPDLKRRLAQMRLSTSQTYYYAKHAYNPYFMANIRVTKEIGRLAALSFYANNFTNSKPMLTDYARPDVPGARMNTDIYFGAELRLTF